MTINDIIQQLEILAPPSYQESYDNARLITGDKNWKCRGVVISLDALESVIDETITKDCNLIIAHHPIIFSGLKSITGKNYIERVIIKAIKNDIAIYAIHTNLDNVSHGVSKKIADKLGLEKVRVLAPKKGLLRKLFTYIPLKHAEEVLNAIFKAGGGEIGNYTECSFKIEGTGTFKGGQGTDPFVGKVGKRHSEQEVKAEVIYSVDRESGILRALKASHPYEEVAYEIISLENEHQEVGSGIIGQLNQPMNTDEFLQFLKITMKTDCVRYTEPTSKTVQNIAVCGGAGSFLLPQAIGAGADVFVTGDFKYHQFFDADGQIVIADIGHYESEQYTGELIYEVLSQKFGNFAVHLSEVNTNPIKYL